MKTLKNTKTYFLTLAVIICASVLFGCSEQGGILTPSSSGLKSESDNPPGDIIVQIQPQSGGFMFVVSNTTADTINDFHVQFDSTVSIVGYSLAWQMDPATTNLAKGKIGEKARPNDQVLLPGQQNRPLLWVQVQFNGRKVIKDFNWQATKNGVVVKSGSGTLP